MATRNCASLQREKENQNEAAAIIRAILQERIQDGATLWDIQKDYVAQTGTLPHQLYYGSFSHIRDYLISLDGVFCYVADEHFGCNDDPEHCRFYIHSELSLYIQQLVRQRPNRSPKTSTPIKIKCHQFAPKLQIPDNEIHPSQRCTIPRTTATVTSRKSTRCNNKTNASVHGYTLLGDDFFMQLAKHELGARVQNGVGHRRQNGAVHHTGYCISGLTIRNALQLIKSVPSLPPQVLINLGSVDILHGHYLWDMQRDYADLVEALERRGVTVVVSTLAPLGNRAHQPRDVRKVLRMNVFLRKLGRTVVDVWQEFVDMHSGLTVYSCYRNVPIMVSGSTEAHLLWNHVGRVRAMTRIRRQLDMLL